MWGQGPVNSLGARCWSRAAAIALLAGGVAACSGDLSRLNDGPFASSSSSETTASIPPGGSGGANTAALSSTPSSGKTGPSHSANADRAVSGSRNNAGKWTWDGGTAIAVADGDSIESIATRHGVPATALMEVNNLNASSVLHSGQRLVIPRQRQAALPPQPASSRALAPAASSAGVHIVATGETLSRISKRYSKSVDEIAKANSIPSTATLNVGDRLVIPGMR